MAGAVQGHCGAEDSLMAFKGGRSVSDRDVRGRARDDPHKIWNLLPKVLMPATVRGRIMMAADYFDAAHALKAFAANAIDNAWLLKVVQNASFVADAATRALFAPGFVSNVLLAGGFLKKTLIAGGAAGDHTVTGIASGDELVAVWEQDGTSGILTDLTSEFSIAGADTINNGGGTDTTGDQLVVEYLDLTA